jgi:phage-related protein
LRFFKTVFLEMANLFINEFDEKTVQKIFYKIKLAEQTNDPRLFKKLNRDIWEFRLRYQKNQIRLLAFWDKSDKQQTKVIVTHGFIKKVSKVPELEIEKAMSIRKLYFNYKN